MSKSYVKKNVKGCYGQEKNMWTNRVALHDIGEEDSILCCFQLLLSLFIKISQF